MRDEQSQKMDSTINSFDRSTYLFIEKYVRKFTYFSISLLADVVAVREFLYAANSTGQVCKVKFLLSAND